MSLSGGFERAAERADLPDLIVRFDEARARGRRRAPRRAAEPRRPQRTGPRSRGCRSRPATGAAAAGRSQVVERGAPRLRDRRRAATSRGGATTRSSRPAWRASGASSSATTCSSAAGGARPVVGVARSPDNVAFPLATVPRVYIAGRGRAARGSGRCRSTSRSAWLRDRAPRGRDAHAGAGGVVRAARTCASSPAPASRCSSARPPGIVIALLVAFSVVALATAGVMLGASARSEVARRLPAIGVAARGRLPARADRRRRRRARRRSSPRPPPRSGSRSGALAMRGPSERLLDALNEVGPGPRPAVVAARRVGGDRRARRRRLGVARVARDRRRRSPRCCAAASWPDVGRTRRRLRARRRAAASTALGARLATARRARWATTVAVLAAASATLVLLLALASLLTALRDDPGTVGKRYSLTANLDEAAVPEVRALDGVADAAPRWQVDGVGAPTRSASRCGSSRSRGATRRSRRRRSPRAGGAARAGRGRGRHRAGRRARAAARARRSPSRCRAATRCACGSAGVVRALENEGRTAYVASEALEPTRRARRRRSSPCALERGADRAAVGRGLRRARRAADARRPRRRRATARSSACWRRVLRVVALTVALVCLAVLAQALVLTVRERRPDDRAAAHDRRRPRRARAACSAGACAVVLVPAALLGRGARVARPRARSSASLAAGYAGLSLAPQAGPPAARRRRPGRARRASRSRWSRARVVREPVVAGLREEA